MMFEKISMKSRRSKEELTQIRKGVEAGGKCKILTFIYDILYHGGVNYGSMEIIHRLFADGYCYYFAKMLEDAFPGGQICIAYPFGHILYVYEGVPYDIDGISSSEYEELIPIEFLGEAINDFRHIYQQDYKITKEEIDAIGKKWKEHHQPIKLIRRFA